jgi:hypothetical protein
MRVGIDIDGARRVTQIENAGQGGIEIGGGDVENAVFLGVFRPSPREAVRLQLLGHGARGEVGPGLHRMTPLVCHHHRDDEIAEFLLQLGQQPFGVPRHHVFGRAVEALPATSLAS